MENLSKELGTNIWCKRDDLTGFAFGGNKTRKLDYLIAEAVNNKYNTLVAVGGIQSNFCRLAAAFGAVNNLKVNLVLGGAKEPKKYSANLFLDKLFNAELHFIESDDWNVWETSAQKLTAKLKTKGLKPYYMPIGGSNTTGALGYIECFDEIVNFSKNEKTKFDYIIHATGSAGTQSGTVLGKAKHNWGGELIGVAVTKNTTQIFNEVSKLAKETGKIEKINFDPFSIKVDDRFIGKCYGALTKEADEAVKLFANKEGIMLDYVYSGKAAAALINYCRNGYFSKTNNILFIHTGGNVALFK